MKNYSFIIFSAIILMIAGCSIGDNLSPDKETSKQKIRLTNYLHDFTDKNEKVGFSRDGKNTVDGVHFSANQIDMYCNYNPNDSLLEVSSNVQMFDASGNLLSEKTQKLVNEKEYTFFAYGVIGETGWFKPSFTVVESDNERAADGNSHVRFAHFNPSYESIKVMVEGQIIPLEFGEISQIVEYDYNNGLNFTVDGKVNGNFVNVHGAGTLNYNGQTNYVLIITKMGQGEDENGVFHHSEIWE